MIRVGIFGDKPQASTGFANVLTHLSKELSQDEDLRVIYFGRFGLEDLMYKPKDGFTPNTVPIQNTFSYVPCQGGVWDRELCVRILHHYNIQVVFCEDDWFSAEGIAGACEFWKIPFHFLTPIDGLPLHPMADKVFQKCDTVYVPNSAWQVVKERKFNSFYLPHGVDTNTFQPMPLRNNDDKFRFLWVGRDDDRKALGRTILAYEKLLSMTPRRDFELMIHTDWATPNAQKTKLYCELKGIPIRGSQMTNDPHHFMSRIYNLADVNIVSAKAGGCEMSIIESAACQVPSLVTAWNFMQEFVVDQKTGFRIPYESLITEPSWGRMWANISIDELANAMLYCLDQPKHIKEMGIQAREYVKQSYSWVETGKQLRDKIKESLKDAKC